MAIDENTPPFFTKVAGITARNDDRTFRQEIAARCDVGEQLELKREPHNQHDKNAVAILRRNGEQLGYLNRELAADLAAAIDNGLWFAAEVSSVTGGEKENLGVNLRITPIAPPSLD